MRGLRWNPRSDKEAICARILQGPVQPDGSDSDKGEEDGSKKSKDEPRSPRREAGRWRVTEWQGQRTARQPRGRRPGVRVACRVEKRRRSKRWSSGSIDRGGWLIKEFHEWVIETLVRLSECAGVQFLRCDYEDLL